MRFKILCTKRRGLSSIVGALLFVVLMVSAFSVIGVSLNSQTDIASTGRDVAAKDLQKQQEDFVLISAQQPPGGFLEIELTNLGQNTAEIFTVVMTNKTDDGEPTKTFEVPSETSFLPPGDNSSTDIFSTSFVKMDIPGPGLQEEYDFKVISSLGTIKTVSLICDGSALLCGTITTPGPPGTASLSAILFLDGPTGINTKTSTVIMFVQNTGTVPLEDVHPVDICPSATFPSFNPGGGAFVNCVRTPDDIGAGNCGVNHDGNGICLAPGQFAIFKWDGEVQGTVDDIFTFCNQVRGEEEDGTVVGPSPDPFPSCDELIVIDPNDCGQPDCGPGGPGDDDPLEEKFITRPELFLTIPSPFGESETGNDDRALWGANVVNPTDTTMYIHKVTITAFPPASNDNFNIIADGGNDGLGCLPQDIHPGDGIIPGTGTPTQKRTMEAGSWSCPGSNTLMWRDYDNPVELLPQSTVPFMVKLLAQSPQSKSAESVLVDSTVYTTSGSFGKGNYQSTTYSKGLHANIFQVNDDGFGGPTDPLNTDNWISSIVDIPSGSEQIFHVALIDFDTNLNTYINATAKVVVNVPRAFTLVDTVSVNGFDWDQTDPNPALREPSVTIHPDDTTQIIATLTNNLGDDADEYATLSFKATAPTVTTTKLMVMYTLANGLGTNDNSVGPLTEIILVVVP